MKQNGNHLLRRQFLRNGLLGGMALLTLAGGLLGTSIGAAGQDGDGQAGINVLINVLRSTENAACLSAADRLEVSRASRQYDLHLRNAGLGVMEAEIIAGAIREVSLFEVPVLKSFSMSYNPGLTDTGVVALAQAFPSSITELGFVGCAIEDEGGAALLRWARQAHELQMICVEKTASQRGSGKGSLHWPRRGQTCRSSFDDLLPASRPR